MEYPHAGAHWPHHPSRQGSTSCCTSFPPRQHAGLYFQPLLGLKALMYLAYISLLHAELPFPRQEMGSWKAVAQLLLQTPRPISQHGERRKALGQLGAARLCHRTQELLLPPGPPAESRASSCALLLFSLQARNMSLGRHGGSFLLLFSSIASSNDNSIIHLLVKHLK